MRVIAGLLALLLSTAVAAQTKPTIPQSGRNDQNLPVATLRDLAGVFSLYADYSALQAEIARAMAAESSRCGADASACTVTPAGSTSARTLAATMAQLLDPAWTAPHYQATKLAPGLVATTDGVHDDTAHDMSGQLLLAAVAMPAVGGNLDLPCGNMVLKSGVTIPGARITLGSADNHFCSQIIASSTFLTGDVLTFTGAYSGVDGLAFDVAATSSQTAGNITPFRSSGYTVNLQNGYGFVKNSSMRSCFVCIELGTYAGHSTVRDVTLEYMADGTANPGSGGIDVNNHGFGPDNWIDHVRMQPNLGAATVYHPSFGIQLRNAGATQITNKTDITGMMTSLLIAPGNGQAVEATKSSNNYYDGATSNSIVVQPTGTGFVLHTTFTNDLCTVVAAAANCLTLIGAGATAQTGQAYPIMDTQWIGGTMRSIGGQTGTGLLIADAYSRDTSLSHATLGGWRYGFNVAAGASHVNIDHNIIGLDGNYPGTSATQTNYVGGNVATGGGDYINIDHNEFPNFQNAALGFAATGVHNRVQDNPGYNPVGVSTLSVTASPMTIAGGPTEDDIYINGGTVSSVTLAGVTVCTASPCVVRRATYQAAVVTYSSAPSVVQSIH